MRYIIGLKCGDLKDGISGVVMTIQTFGDYADKFHPHITVSVRRSSKSTAFNVLRVSRYFG
ncbi:MAG: hypothetical protein V3T96_00625 [Thermodesulfobacteriota bacterium]